MGVVVLGAGEGVGRAFANRDEVEVEELLTDEIFQLGAFALRAAEVVSGGSGIGHEGDEFADGIRAGGGGAMAIRIDGGGGGWRAGTSPIRVGRQRALDLGGEEGGGEGEDFRGEGFLQDEVFGSGFFQQRGAEDATEVGERGVRLEKGTAGLTVLRLFQQVGGGKEALGFLAVAERERVGVFAAVLRLDRLGREGEEAGGEDRHAGGVLPGSQRGEEAEKGTAMLFWAIVEEGF